MKRALFAAAVLSALTLSVPAKADSISAVEGARAHERAGSPLTRQEREKLHTAGTGIRARGITGRTGTKPTA
jgi:hypothetical protein